MIQAFQFHCLQFIFLLYWHNLW